MITFATAEAATATTLLPQTFTQLCMPLMRQVFPVLFEHIRKASWLNKVFGADYLLNLIVYIQVHGNFRQCLLRILVVQSCLNSSHYCIKTKILLSLFVFLSFHWDCEAPRQAPPKRWPCVGFCSFSNTETQLQEHLVRFWKFIVNVFAH